jgi:putative permease
MKRLAIYSVSVLATVTAVIFLWQFRGVLLLFLLSLALASAARPLVTRLVQRGVPLWLGTLLTYLAGLSLLAALLLLLGPALLGEGQHLADKAAAAYEQTWLAWTRGETSQQAIAARLPPPDLLLEALTGAQGELLAQRLFNLTTAVSAILGSFIVALALSVYWTVDQARFERLWLSLLPAGQRGQARLIWQAIEDGVGAYIRSEVVQSFIGIVLLYVGYRLIGLPYAALLALLGGLAWLVPLVGVFLTVVPVYAAGMLVGVEVAITAVVYTFAILLLLELLVEPRFFNRRRYSSLLTVLLMLILIEDFGVIGLILAPPLSAAIQIFGSHWLAAQKAANPTGAANQLSVLRERLAQVEANLQERADPPAPEVLSVADRLDKLIHRADQIVQHNS